MTPAHVGYITEFVWGHGVKDMPQGNLEKSLLVTYTTHLNLDRRQVVRIEGMQDHHGQTKSPTIKLRIGGIVGVERGKVCKKCTLGTSAGGRTHENTCLR